MHLFIQVKVYGSIICLNARFVILTVLLILVLLLECRGH